jgi:hypothetical protein
MRDFRKYEAMRDEGATPETVLGTAQADGLDLPTCFAALRTVFGLSMVDAKGIYFEVGGSVDELEALHRNVILPTIQQYIDEEDED